jgi:hypothetical protein
MSNSSRSTNEAMCTLAQRIAERAAAKNRRPTKSGPMYDMVTTFLDRMMADL